MYGPSEPDLPRKTSYANGKKKGAVESESSAVIWSLSLQYFVCVAVANFASRMVVFLFLPLLLLALPLLMNKTVSRGDGRRREGLGKRVAKSTGEERPSKSADRGVEQYASLGGHSCSASARGWG